MSEELTFQQHFENHAEAVIAADLRAQEDNNYRYWLGYQQAIRESAEEADRLRETYAPTLTLPEEDFHELKDFLIHSHEMGADFTEFWLAYRSMVKLGKFKKLFESQEQAMIVFLHPETLVKV